MKWSALATAAVLPLASAHGFTHGEYASGEVMDLMMSSKEAAWAKHRAAGDYDSKKWIGFDKKRANKDKIECKHGRVEAVKGDADQVSQFDCFSSVNSDISVDIQVQEHRLV